MATGNDGQGERVYHDLKKRASAGMEDIQEAARERAEHVSSDVGRHAENVAEAVRSAGESLRGKEDWLADAAENLGRSLERLSSTAREKGFDGIKHDLEQLARDRPVVFMGSAVAVGLALGRVLRSSPPIERRAREWRHDADEATEPGSEQIGPGAGWPSAPDAAATPVGSDGAGGTR